MRNLRQEKRAVAFEKSSVYNDHMSDESVYRSAAAQGGWLFEKSKESQFECSWNDMYFLLKKKHVLKGGLVLDIGSAEGLKLINIADEFLFGVGIDLEPAMIDLARKNASKCKIQNVRFHSMDSNHLLFPNDFFDFVICRHAPFNLEEVYRVLKKGGLFVTQQVHERDKQNLKEHFGRGQNYKIPTDTALKNTLKLARKMTFECVEQKVSNMDYYFNSKAHLIDFLKKTPVIPDYSTKKDRSLTDLFIHKYQNKKGIKSNSARTLLIFKK